MKKHYLSAHVFLFGLLISGVAMAQVPRTLSYQGVLTDAAGNPVANGGHTVAVRIYDVAAGGVALYTETHSVNTDRGIFNIVIGSITPIPASVAFDRQYYMSVAIDGAAELAQRTRLTASPYAIRSAVADGISPTATGVVTSVNGRSGAVTLQGGGGTTITQAGQTVTISSSGGGGGTGIQGVQNSDGSITVTNPNGPVATIGVADNAIGSLQIGDGAITAADLSAGVIPTSLPPSGAAGGDLAGTYPNPTIAPNAVGGTEIEDLSIQTGDLANAAVTPAKINTTGATNGQVLTYNGTALVFATPNALTLPFSASASSTSTLFDITNTGTGRAGYFRSNNAAATGHALMGESNGPGNWGGPAGVHGRHTTAGGIGVYGEATAGLGATGVAARGVYGVAAAGAGVYGYSTTGTGLQGTNDGSGAGLVAMNSGTGRAAHLQVLTATSGATTLLSTTVGLGMAGDFQITNTGSTANALRAETDGSGAGVYGYHSSGGGTSPGVFGESNSTAPGGGANNGATGVLGVIRPVAAAGWSAGVRGINNATGLNGIGVIGYQAGGGWGVYGETPSGIGVHAVAGAGGNAFVAQLNGAVGSTPPANNVAIFRTNGINVARIDRLGAGFFNGGTFNAGADVAEAFAVEGIREQYEPGDVLVISTATDRTVEHSSDAYSPLVIGVYATKPGVTLTERSIDDDHSDMVPMGVIGVIPTKVTTENGPIRRGDLLVTSSTRGHAMRVDPAKALPGTIIGKALENFDGEGSGKIRVMVNVK